MSKPIAIQRTQKEKEERKLYWSSIIRQLLQHGRPERNHIFPIRRLKIKDHEWNDYLNKYGDIIRYDLHNNNCEREDRCRL
jgi:hypothetical protein